MRTPEELTAILDGVRFDSDAGEGETIRHYLWKLLQTLWVEGEGFSGKRPFGNSSWDFELYGALVDGGHVNGSCDSCGDLGVFDRFEADKLITELIAHMCGVKLED